jgi:hypothetical protein
LECSQIFMNDVVAHETFLDVECCIKLLFLDILFPIWIFVVDSHFGSL